MKFGKQTGTALLAATAALSLGCSSDEQAGKGSVSVILEAEDVVIEGLQPGDDLENIHDGWTVTFDKYIVAIGHIDLHFATDESIEAEAEEAYVIDLTEISASGLDLWLIDELDEGSWEVHYAVVGAGDGAERHESVSEEDFDEMADGDFSYLIDGKLENEAGQSCPPSALVDPGEKVSNGNTSGGNDCYDAPELRFYFGASAETAYGPCEIDGIPGVAVTAGTTQTVALTIHGDHIFFNGFPEGTEGGITRLAQWLADCDLDLDGTVTQSELEAIAPSDLPEIDDRYQLGGSPITPLDNMYEYVTAQLKTQGHYQGEGECALDGVEHDHDHEDE